MGLVAASGVCSRAAGAGVAREAEAGPAAAVTPTTVATGHQPDEKPVPDKSRRSHTRPQILSSLAAIETDLANASTIGFVKRTSTGILLAVTLPARPTGTACTEAETVRSRAGVSARGSASSVEHAFSMMLGYYMVNGHKVRLANGTMTAPSSVAGIVARAVGVNQYQARLGPMPGS